MREIVLDTETTGFEPSAGHRLAEIGCVELMHRLPTGRTYHVYLNPERPMPEAAFRVHGLSDDFLKDQPLFRSIADDFLTFIGEDPLVIHNATFDMKFLNAELTSMGREALEYSRAVDTLLIAKKTFPGSPANLDALCRRFNIDNSHREKHGALLDSELLAEVYLELTGGRQRKLEIESFKEEKVRTTIKAALSRKRYPARTFKISEEESAAHSAFLQKLKDPKWSQF
tara:strand:+ start:1142 stop:1825 length:684 start_codon:yes stop_codon:yes gene_type:complete